MGTRKQGGSADPYDRFRKWLKGPPARRQVDVAKAIHVSQQYVSAIKNGRAVPSPLVRVRLKLLAGIDVNLWPDAPPLTNEEVCELSHVLNATDTDAA